MAKQTLKQKTYKALDRLEKILEEAKELQKRYVEGRYIDLADAASEVQICKDRLVEEEAHYQGIEEEIHRMENELNLRDVSLN